jgi:hypothetical protein
MPRGKAIMTYGTQSDRLRVAAMAKLKKLSISEYLLQFIRDDYRAVYGETPPEKLDARVQC